MHDDTEGDGSGTNLSSSHATFMTPGLTEFVFGRTGMILHAQTWCN